MKQSRVTAASFAAVLNPLVGIAVLSPLMMGNLGGCPPDLILASIDIKPSSCPNSFNRNGNGVLPVALAGTVEFDPTEVDLSSLQLSRADGVGGSVAPNEGPPGPHLVLEDVATPFDLLSTLQLSQAELEAYTFDGSLCVCHDLGGDGIDDLSMKFRTDELVEALELGALPDGSLVELELSGNLLDGTDFVAMDCIRLVPPGTPGTLLSVTSNLSEAWVDVSPLDETLDGGGFADFVRNFPQTTVIRLAAETVAEGRPLIGWRIDGEFVPLDLGPLFKPITVNIEYTVTADEVGSVEAVYGVARRSENLGLSSTPVIEPDDGIVGIVVGG